MPARTTLYWKYEDGPPDASGADPNDVGPAWIIDSDGGERDVRDGEWITRAEAIRIADEQGFALGLDDGATDPEDVPANKAVDLEGLNARLRAIGVSERQLLVESKYGGFDLVGTIPDAYARRDGPPAVIGPEGHEPADHLVRCNVASAEGLFELLDQFAPGWR